MTGERTKRFPLGLADLVREPRRRDGLDSRHGEARGPLGGAGKTGVAKDVANPSVPRAGGGIGASTPGRTQGAAHKSPVSGASTAPARPNDVRRGNAAPHAAQPATHLLQASANRSAAARSNTPQRTSGTPTSGAPGVPLNSALALTSERVRERMVERLRANGIADARVLQALAGVPRHMFVDPGLATQAYEDAALPIGHQQTISKPSVVARMLELAGTGRTLDRVLEIGTGCGYQAAVLSQIARDVYSIERIKPLYERAKRNLRPLRIPNIRLHYGDGRLGLPSAAPFDAIVIAAAGFDVPQALLEQLAIGGRLVAPVASPASAGGEATQVLTLVERTGPAQWRESRLDRVFFVPLKSGVI
ncbi:protein-L-isoaspartate(D-aspartate) O-methyltransferase [Paraburkholderia dinghuensis]|uniref:Protein-L-isoaspartate O-methyltransferase n=1 Tax=Paraburkholderia dinghuensis TaxID=2305225 RepID=A0A3N6MUB1_9BURK|nr:protein-L-isoaspartate(D-aspartate) O-methyltransferase [Paraburkholderia dinghuensis]RQH07594.1 protein-L-isoaspartate(D-aspartate) O-methyltransferase [Paraburkholderia dinghuensis]